MENINADLSAGQNCPPDDPPLKSNTDYQPPQIQFVSLQNNEEGYYSVISQKYFSSDPDNIFFISLTEKEEDKHNWKRVNSQQLLFLSKSETYEKPTKGIAMKYHHN